MADMKFCLIVAVFVVVESRGLAGPRDGGVVFRQQP